MKTFTADKKFFATTIYVGNLNYKTQEEDLKKIFEYYGKVESINIIEDKLTKKRNGLAFVKMPNKTQAINAVEKMNAKKLDGRTIKVSIANDRYASEDVPTDVSEIKKLSIKTEKKVITPRRRKIKGIDVLMKFKEEVSKYNSRSNQKKSL